MKKSNIKWIIGVVLIPLLIAIGFFNNPNVILVRQVNSDFVCPTYFYSNSEFEINFKNVGNKGINLCVELSSPENITFIKKSDCLYSEAGKERPFSLQINDSSIYDLDSLQINYNYQYNKYLIWNQNKSVSCYYERERGTRIALKLVHQDLL